MRAILLALYGLVAATSTAHAHDLKILRNGGQRASLRPPENFTGHAVVTPLFAATPASRAAAASVTFAPGARTRWHTHPAGQTLVVTAGVGWVQIEGGARQEIRPGDVIWTPPGVRHWHGATTSNDMTHIAVQEHINGKVVGWMEPVTEAQYVGAP